MSQADYHGPVTSQGRDGADRIPVAWVMALYDALIPRDDVAARDAAMARWCRQEPSTAQVWFAGVIFSVMGTLPDTDPWSHLSARVDRSTTRGTAPPPDVGATGEHGRFGTVDDGRDLAGNAEDPALDLYLAALAESLDDRSAAVLAFARDGWRQALVALSTVTSADATFDVGSAALRWAAWRRRCYIPADDPHLLTQAGLWIRRARAAGSGNDWDEDAAAREVTVAGRIPERAYAGLMPEPRFGMDVVRSMIKRTQGETREG